MNGSLPPSSSTTFLPAAPACSATARPAPTLPVSVTAATRGSAMICGTWSIPMSSVWRTPSGAPARRKRSSRARAVRGTFGACFNSPTLPAMTAGAMNRVTCQRGKFHGMIASTAPSGWLTIRPVAPPRSTTSVASSRSPCSANQRNPSRTWRPLPWPARTACPSRWSTGGPCRAARPRAVPPPSPATATALRSSWRPSASPPPRRSRGTPRPRRRRTARMTRGARRSSG